MFLNTQVKKTLNYLLLLVFSAFITNPFQTHASDSEESEGEIFNLPRSPIKIEGVGEEEEVSEEEGTSTSSRYPQQGKMAFKLGFEFEEEFGLCPWAVANTHIQKKRLFSIIFSKDNKRNEHWHVVIDENDIEFVTRPFSYHERDDLSLCMDTLLAATDLLKVLLDEHPIITFRQWTGNIAGRIQDLPLFLKYLVLN